MTGRVLLAGPYGQRNPGDEALLAAFRAALPDHEVIPTAGTTTPQEVARRVRDADAVVFGGGTLFKQLRPASGRPPLDLVTRALGLAVAARAAGRPLAMVGVGVGALSSRRGQLLARRIVHQADLLVLRDEESAGLLSEMGAPAPFRVGADPAWTLLAAAPDGGWDPSGPVRVACSHEAGGLDTVEHVAAALRHVLAAGVRVELQPWQVGGPGTVDDLDFARAVRARLGGAAKLVLPPEDLAEAVDAMRGACAILAMRFHAIPAACVAGTPVVAFDHEAKLAALSRRLGRPALSPDAGPEALAAALLAAGRCGEHASGAAIRGEIAAAEEGFRLLRLLLSGGGSFEDAASLGQLPLRPQEWTA